MNKSLFVFLAALSTFSEAELITYQYDITLDDAFGSLAAGTILTGEISFESEQSGTDIPDISNTKRFELSALSLSDGSESIEMNITSDNDGWIVVGDNSPPPTGIDFFSVRAEGPIIFTGTLGGLAVHSLFLGWQDINGTANDGFSLPLNESTFDAYESANGQLQGAIGGANSSITILKVSSIPIPPFLYNYTGNAFETFSSPSSWDETMNMSVTFELSDTLDPNLFFSTISPISYSFTDGVNTITDEDVAANPLLHEIIFEFSTDSTGVITDWYVVAEFGPGTLENIDDSLIRIFTAGSGSTPQDIGIIFTCISINPDGSCSTTGDWASSLPNNPGIWTVSEVSIPAAPDGDINNDGQVNVADLLLAMRILNGQYTPSPEEQAHWDVSPLVNGVPEPDQQNNLGDYLILQRKVLGNISF